MEGEEENEKKENEKEEKERLEKVREKKEREEKEERNEKKMAEGGPRRGKEWSITLRHLSFPSFLFFFFPFLNIFYVISFFFSSFSSPPISLSFSSRLSRESRII